MNYGSCVYCNDTVYSSDERVNLSWGVAHYECHEREQEEIHDQMLKAGEDEMKRREKDNRIMARLEKTLKPKFWQPIKWVREENYCQDLEIVGIEKVKGTKTSTYDFFGEGAAIRHVFEDVSSDGDTYGGFIWIPIGKGRYLQMHIWG
ncbi:hypothetical protein REH81_02190 [Vibrio rotiferianus]